MPGPAPIEQPREFARVDSVSHDGVVVAFGEEWSETPEQRRLWYRVLDLQQTADQELETSWEDSTRWTRWYEVPWPEELRAIGLSIFDVMTTVDHRYATVKGGWKVIDDGDHVYLFRALDLTALDDAPRDDAMRVYATRYRLVRMPSPDAGTNRGAKGQEITVPQLVPMREARYRRSAVRESPLGDTDSQGTRDLGNLAFGEPTMEWSMLRPLDGSFTVTLTPSNLPGRMRWQFFCKDEKPTDDGSEPAIACYSILRDDDGWADLDEIEKFNRLNDDPDDRFRLRADRVVTLRHPDLGVLAMEGQPSSTTFRLQEQSTPVGSTGDVGSTEEEGRALSGQRVMLAMRLAPPAPAPIDPDPSTDQSTDPAPDPANDPVTVADPGDPGTNQSDPEQERLVVVDFGLDELGAADVPESLDVSDVDFARSALRFNSLDDRVRLTDGADQEGDTFTAQAWVRHDQGNGSIVCRGWEPGLADGAWTDAARQPAGADSTAAPGWAIEWRANRIAGIRVLGAAGSSRVFRVEAMAPGSFTWHHIALVQDGPDLILAIDGVEADRLTIESAEPGDVSGDVVIGGPPSPVSTTPEEPGWVEFRIDQLVLTQAAVMPSLDTIYAELDETAQASDDVLGYWTFDRVNAEDPDGYDLDKGVDEVNQTAPLFPADKAEFEAHIAGMSTGMGVVTIPDWDAVADPNLFLGADGVVRLYVAADPTGDDGRDADSGTAGFLAYDTTTTRAQFAVPWVATGGQSERQGALTLQAREPGPIMNRAVVEVEQAGDTTVRLTVSHPHRDGFGEVWENLPASVTDFIAVLSGEAGPPGDEPDPEDGPPPLTYDYLQDGPLPSSVPYRSEVVQAFALVMADNGAEALVQPGTAALSQQGNFTGWTRPPLAVSGHLGGLVAATTDVDAGPLDRLRIPGDFATELWIKPGSEPDEQRIINWRQSEDDGFALAVQSTDQFSMRSRNVKLDDPLEFSRVVLEEGDDAPTWYSTPGGGFEIEASFQLPDGGGAGSERALATLTTTTTVTLDSADLFDAVRRLRQADVDAMSVAAKESAQSALDDWAPETKELTVDIECTMRLGLHSKSIIFDLRYDVVRDGLKQADADLLAIWEDYLTGRVVSGLPDVTWTVTETANQGFCFSRDDEDPDDDEKKYLVRVAAAERDGSPINVVVTVDPTSEVPSAGLHPLPIGIRPRITCSIDGRIASIRDESERPQSPAEDDESTDPPPPPPPRWFIPFNSARSALVAGQVVDDDDSWPAFTGPVHELTTRAGERGVETRSTTFAGLAEEFYTGTLSFEPMLGDRRYEAIRTFTADDWLHAGVVCSDNFAARFDGVGDRGVISDASHLTPDNALTIDCVIVREADTDGTILSRAVEIGEDRAVSFRLSIDGGKAHLQYTVDVEGESQVHDVWSSTALELDKPYHIVASVKIESVNFPEQVFDSETSFEDADDKPKDRWQFWIAHHGVWVFDITDSKWITPEPRDFTVSSGDLALIVIAEAWEQVFGSDVAKLFFPVLFSGFGFPQVPYTVLGKTRDIDPYYDIRLKSTDGPAAIGAATGEDPERLPPGVLRPFGGLIGSVRVWRSSLTGEQVKKLPREPGVPNGVDAPDAWWKFDENRGLQATDSVAGMTATLTREEMWVTTRATARLTFYLNGRAVPLRPIPESPGESVDYGDVEQFTVGGRMSGNSAHDIFDGLVDDVRVWSDIRTGEEMLDTMHALLGGNEDDLAAWWPLNAGVGTRVKDASYGGGAHLDVVGLEPAADDVSFWADDAAPIGDDLPQLRHLLGGLATSWTRTGATAAAMAAEYGDIQTDEDGRITGVQKRAAVIAVTVADSTEDETSFGWVTPTGFKTGDLDLIYVGQAQSDPTMIGYIEGAPPIPSENLTRPHWQSATGYDAYNDRTKVTLRQAENTSTIYSASYDRGFDMSIAGQVLFVVEGRLIFGTGVAFGGFLDAETEAVDLSVEVGPKFSFDLGLGWQKAFQTSIGTTRSTADSLGLSGSWEPTDGILNPQVGRRYVPDNTGYALVTSGVANVYAMRLRRNGAMLGLTMVPDPDIPEDYNIITFKIRPTHTKQGTLDGRVGLMTDPDWTLAAPGRGSYFRPLEAANLEAQIEAYEAKLLAAYDSFDAGSYGRRSAGRHFSDDDAAQNPQNTVEGRTVVPYDWERNINRRNIVNTYVWTASGGFFAEETATSIERSESIGGSYSFKGMAGVQVNGKVAIGMGALAGATWDVSAMFGGHIQTTVTKTKTEGRDFGLDVAVDCDGLLERYIGSGNQLYSGVPEPGKVSSYRFKSFYLVPEKSHFEDFWSQVVDDDWLESDDLDAVALRQARGNQNQVWRVLHRCTYVQRIPPSGDRPPPAPRQPTRTVVHQGPNWQLLKLALDVLRTGQTSDGTDISQLTRPEQLAEAADDLVRRQWPVLSPRWASAVDAFETDATSADGLVVAELRRRTYEYLRAYNDTGLLDLDPRLMTGPTIPIDGPPPEPEPPELPPLDSLKAGGADALHLFTFDQLSLGIDEKGGDFLEYTRPTTIAHDDLPPGLGGRLILPGPSATKPAGRAKISLSGDWGRIGPRTWEVCFRLTESGPVVILAPTVWVPETQRPFRWLAIDGEGNDDKLAIWPIGADESVSLPGVDVNSVGKLVYAAIGYTPPVEAPAPDQPSQGAVLDVAWAVEGRTGVQRRTLPTEAGDLAGGPMTLGGSGQEQFGHEKTRGSLEILHLAVHDEVFSAAELARRLRTVGLEP